MGHEVGVLTRSLDKANILKEFLKKKGYSPVEFDTNHPHEVDIIIADVDSWNRKAHHSIKGKGIPVLFVSTSTTKKQIPTGLLDELEKSDFVEVEIKENQIYPEFILHFKIGVLLKLKKGTPIKISKSSTKREPNSVLSADQFQPPHRSNEQRSAIVVIGSSAGGPGTLVRLLSQIKYPTPPIIIVQHITSTFAETLAARLDSISSFRLRIARDGDFVQNNCAYLAPPNFHLEFEQLGNRIRIKLTDGPRINFVKPAVDVTLFSAARLKGVHTISVILTGMGSDGKEGSKVVKRMGGTIIALNEEDSVVFGMNRSVIEADLADYILPMSDIPIVLRRISHYFVDS